MRNKKRILCRRYHYEINKPDMIFYSTHKGLIQHVDVKASVCTKNYIWEHLKDNPNSNLAYKNTSTVFDWS